MQKGTVIKSTGSWYNVRLDDSGEVLQCRIIGKFRLDDIPLTNPVAVGDQVEVDTSEALIKKILPRVNYVVRQSPRRKHDMHLLAANLDQVVLITTVVQPTLKPGFIDRFLLMTEKHEIPVIIVCNKADAYDEDDMALFSEVKAVYEKIGYSVLLASAYDGRGIAALGALLKDKTTLISGQSGVGKSTLVNAIQPHLTLRTGEISDYSGKGQHTTTFAEMFSLDFGGSIIDTPGIKTLAFNNMELQNVAHSFREFFEMSQDCKFGGACLHRTEPGCAVRSAVAAGEMSEWRYTNYLTILDEVENQNYWEIRDEF